MMRCIFEHIYFLLGEVCAIVILLSLLLFSLVCATSATRSGCNLNTSFAQSATSLAGFRLVDLPDLPATLNIFLLALGGPHCVTTCSNLPNFARSR